MSWENVKLEALAAAIPYSLIGGPFGSKLTSRDYVDAGVPVIRGSNLNGGRYLNTNNLVYVTDNKVRDDLSSNLAGPLDLVFTQRGTLGQVAIIPEDSPFEKYVISQSQMKMTVDSTKADLRYLYYYFTNSEVIHRIKSYTSSSGVPHINLTVLRNFEIRIPSLGMQKAIADVLSGYDDLIETNDRRIMLLERAARTLYEEWFVRLRFPGYEHVRGRNGVPDEWVETDLESVCVPDIGIQTGPFGSQLHQSDYAEEGIPVVMPKDIIGSRVSTDSIARVPEEIQQRLSRHVLRPGDIVLARRGDIGRKAFVTERESGWMCGTGCMRLRPNHDVVAPRLLYDTLGRVEVMGLIAGRAQGAIMPNLNLSILADVPLVLPPLRLQHAYLDLSAPVHRQAELLAEQNLRLRAARELLLPRLMSGEVAI